MIMRNDIEPINSGPETDWQEYVIDQTRRKVAKCLGELGGRCSKSSVKSIKHYFWETCEAVKLLSDTADGFEEDVEQAVSDRLSGCLTDLGMSVSPSEKRTIQKWFTFLKVDIIAGN